MQVTNATLNMNPECRLSAKSFFLLTKDPQPCYVGTDARYRMPFVKNQSQTVPSLRVPLMAQDLSPGQRSLVELMQKHQFGRIENMPVRAGEPILYSEVNVVRTH